MDAVVWIDAPAQGTWNMALDQAMLQYAFENNCIVLRLYQWSRPTLSLGYFQAYDDRFLHPDLSELDCVRRVTGGGAIVHDHEVTYSIAIPSSAFQQARSAVGGERASLASTGHSELLYRTVHSKAMKWLRQLEYPATLFELSGNESCTGDSCKGFLCFDRRSGIDLIVNDQKILGSAQRRSSQGLLQHGSLLYAATESAPHLTGLEYRVSGRTLPQIMKINNSPTKAENWLWLIDFCRVLQDSMDGLWECNWIYGEPNEKVLEKARQIQSEVFSNDNWTIYRSRKASFVDEIN